MSKAKIQDQNAVPGNTKADRDLERAINAVRTVAPDDCLIAGAVFTGRNQVDLRPNISTMSASKTADPSLRLRLMESLQSRLYIEIRELHAALERQHGVTIELDPAARQFVWGAKP